MKNLFIVSLALLSITLFAAGPVPGASPTPKIAPVPGSLDQIGLKKEDVKKKINYCAKVKISGVKDAVVMCAPQKKKNCLCANE